MSTLDERDERVEAVFTDGSTADYALVVGADGIHSAVRRHVAGQASRLEYAGQITYRSLAPLKPAEPHGVQFWLGEGCFFGLCAVGDDHTYGFAQITRDREHVPVEGRRRRLQEHFADFGPPVSDYLDSLEPDAPIHCSSVEWLNHAVWHTKRVVLIGDAAHAGSPLMGQGGCLAMEDAVVLAELLSAEQSLIRGADDVDRTLEAFVERRTPRVEWVRQQSVKVSEGFHAPRTARNALLRERGDVMLRNRYQPLIPPP